MIISVGLNHTVEKVYTVDRLTPGQTNRAILAEQYTGGEAAIIARLAHELGEPVLLTGLCGKTGSGLLKELLADERMDSDLAISAGTTRQNITFTDGETGFVYRLEEASPPWDERDGETLRSKIASLATKGGIMLFSGDLPPGAPPDLYAGLLCIVREAGGSAGFTASRQSLAGGLPGRPHMMVLTRTQMEFLLQKQNCSMETLIEGVLRLALNGSEIIALSIGGSELIAAWGSDVYHASAARGSAAITSGTVEALMAGFAVGLARRWAAEETIRTALAATVASALSARSGKLRLIDVEALWEQVQLRRI